MSAQLQVIDANSGALESWSSIKDIKDRLAYVSQALREILREGPEADYGSIPGVNSKRKVLFKPGAEKLCMVFRLTPIYEVVSEPLIGEHYRTRVICTLRHIESGRQWGSGMASCSTMETKYRWRDAPGTTPVPKEYWDAKKRGDWARANEILGGRKAVKNQDDGRWYLGEGRVENPDIADLYNTIDKMAAKRAYVAAVISATGVSDMFTQDIGDDETHDVTPPASPAARPASSAKAKGKAFVDKAAAAPDPEPEDIPFPVAVPTTREKLKQAARLAARADDWMGVLNVASGNGDLSDDGLAWAAGEIARIANADTTKTVWPAIEVRLDQSENGSLTERILQRAINLGSGVTG